MRERNDFSNIFKIIIITSVNIKYLPIAYCGFLYLEEKIVVGFFISEFIIVF